MENTTSKLPSGEAKNNSSEQHQGEEENPKFNSVMTAIDNDSGEEENPNSNSGDGVPVQSSRRTPFTNLSQIDADLALARTLQEQERAYMLLSAMSIGSDSGSWVGSYYEEEADNEVDFDEPAEEGGEGEEGDDRDGDDENNDSDDDADAFDIHENADDDEDDDNNSEVEIDPSAFSSDEAFARALQEAEERDLDARLLALAGINRGHVDAEDIEDHGGNSQDAWEEVDPDELSYEELLALGEVVGTETRGLSADTIASLPSVNYKRENDQNGNGTSECCVICRLDYEDGETLTALACKHLYHTECINNWLNINKVCPICNVEVSTSGRS